MNTRERAGLRPRPDEPDDLDGAIVAIVVGIAALALVTVVAWFLASDRPEPDSRLDQVPSSAPP